MISEAEVRSRAEYMGMVHRQLEILRSRRSLPDAEVVGLIRSSSLRLADIEWVGAMVEEAARLGRMPEALEKLAMYYEGYFEALARVLEVKPDALRATFDSARLRRIEAEMMGFAS